MEKQKAVTNSSSLIFIAKLNIFDLTKNIFSKLLIPQQVIKEILKKESPETELIKKELNSFLQEIKIERIRALPLGEGEKAAISYCLENNIKIFISDDKKARRFARSSNLKTIGVLGILLKNLENKKINKQEFSKHLNKLIEKGYFISPNLYSEIMQIISNFK